LAFDIFPGDFRVSVLDTKANWPDSQKYEIIEPKFQIFVLLSGRQEFFLEHQRIEIDAGKYPQAAMMYITRPSRLRFAGSTGDPYTKIGIAAPCEWLSCFLADQLPGSGLLSRHRDCVTWQPDVDTIRLARQIVSPPPGEAKAQIGLFRMSRAIEIVRRALTDHLPQAQPCHEYREAERIRLYLNQNLYEPLSLDRIEFELSLNRRSIQRHFRKSYGCTLRDYIRDEKLARARKALSEDGVSVSEAAYIAGYRSAANFATAFRRAYGHAPSEIRSRSI
jgi:AraC-like DNA-binding protein